MHQGISIKQPFETMDTTEISGLSVCGDWVRSVSISFPVARPLPIRIELCGQCNKIIHCCTECELLISLNLCNDLIGKSIFYIGYNVTPILTFPQDVIVLFNFLFMNCPNMG